MHWLNGIIGLIPSICRSSMLTNTDAQCSSETGVSTCLIFTSDAVRSISCNSCMYCRSENFIAKNFRSLCLQNQSA